MYIVRWYHLDIVNCRYQYHGRRVQQGGRGPRVEGHWCWEHRKHKRLVQGRGGFVRHILVIFLGTVLVIIEQLNPSDPVKYEKQKNFAIDHIHICSCRWKVHMQLFHKDMLMERWTGMISGACAVQSWKLWNWKIMGLIGSHMHNLVYLSWPTISFKQK